MKIQQLKNNNFNLTIPLQIIRAKSWKKGDDIKIEINKEGDLVLKKK